MAGGMPLPGGTMATPAVMEKIRTLSQAAADAPSPEQVRARLEWLLADHATRAFLF